MLTKKVNPILKKDEKKWTSIKNVEAILQKILHQLNEIDQHLIRLNRR